MQDTLCVDVRVVQAENLLLRSLGNVCLFYHAVQRHGPNEGIHQVQFRAGATEHRETANLAMRMDGRELPLSRFFKAAVKMEA